MYVNFKELNFDATDADTLKKYLDAMITVSEKAENLDKDAPQPKQYRYLCKSVKSCFDEIFGAGMGEKICGANDSLRVCTNAYRELVEEYNRQMREQDKANEALAAAMTVTDPKDSGIVTVNGEGEVIGIE